MSFHPRKKFQDPDKNPFYERIECKIFVGGIPLDVTILEFRAFVAKWGYNIVKTYYKASEGQQYAWGMVEFPTPREQTNFLKDHERKKKTINNTILDIKPFTKPRKETEVSTMSSRSHAVDGATARPSLPVGHVSHVTTVGTEVDMPSKNLQLGNAVTAVIIRYVEGTDFGILKTQSIGNGFFHVDTVSYCSVHRLLCKEVDCKYYKRYNKNNNGGKTVDQILPVGTQVNCIYRVINIAMEVRFQATLLWPHNSKKPTNVPEMADAVSNDQLVNFMTSAPSAKKKSISSHPTNTMNSATATTTSTSSRAYSSPAPSLQHRRTITDSPSAGPIRPPPPPPHSPALNPSNHMGASGVIPKVPRAVESPPPPLPPPQQQPLRHSNLKGIDVVLEKMHYLLNFFRTSCSLGDKDRKVLIPLAREMLRLSESVNNEPTAVYELLRFYELQQVNISSKDRDLAVANLKALFPTLCNSNFAPTNNRNPASSSSLSLSTPSSNSGSLADFGTIGNMNSAPAGAGGVSFGDLIVAASESAVEMPRLNPRSPPPMVSDLERSQGATAASSSQEDIPDSWSDDASSSSSSDGSAADAIIESLNALSLGYKTARDLGPVKELNSGQQGDPLATTLDACRGLLDAFNGLERCAKSRIEGEEILYRFNLNAVSKAVAFTWTKLNQKKKSSNLMSELNLYYDNAKGLLEMWRRESIDSWQGNGNISIAAEEIVRLTVTYAWLKAFEGNSHKRTLAVFMATPVATAPANVDSPWLLSGVRGIVVNHFDASFGLVQTEYGKVLFEKEMAVVVGEDESPLRTSSFTWERCSSLADQLPVGSLVRVHARSETRSGSNQQYLYATKVFTATWTFVEPFTGVTVPGGIAYWNDCKKAFGQLVFENGTHLVMNREAGLGSQISEYRKAYDVSLKAILAEKKTRSSGAIKSKFQSGSSPELESFEPFNHFVRTTHNAIHKRIATGVGLIASMGVSLTALRQDYIAKQLITSGPLFIETLEILLLHSDKRLPAGTNFTDPIPFLVAFFDSADTVAVSHLDQQRKALKSQDGIKTTVGPVEMRLQPLQDAISGAVGGREPVNFFDINDSTDVSATSSPVRRVPTAGVDEGMQKLEKMLEEQSKTISSLVERVDTMAAKQAELSHNVNNLMANGGSGNSEDNWKKNMEEIMQAKSEEIRQLTSAIQGLRENSEGVGGSNGDSTSRREIVRISDASSEDVFEFSTDNNGFLQAASVEAIFPGLRLLKTKKGHDNEATTVVPLDGGVFKPPPGLLGFGDRVYIAHTIPPAPLLPGPPAVSNGNKVTTQAPPLMYSHPYHPSAHLAQAQAAHAQAQAQAQAQAAQMQAYFAGIRR